MDAKLRRITRPRLAIGNIFSYKELCLAEHILLRLSVSFLGTRFGKDRIPDRSTDPYPQLIRTELGTLEVLFTPSVLLHV